MTSFDMTTLRTVTTGLRFPEGPIALAEVQGYCYGAHVGFAALCDTVGRGVDAQVARTRAAALREQFNASFWDGERGWFVLGLDGDKRQIDALATNAGHSLWTGIAEPALADRYLAHLGGPAMFTGWGLRTLSCGQTEPLWYEIGL